MLIKLANDGFFGVESDGFIFVYFNWKLLSVRVFTLMKKIKIASIYVSHKSEKYINFFGVKNFSELGDYLYVVNSHEKPFKAAKDLFEVIEAGANVGFSVANNMGIEEALKNEVDFVIFVNPDIYLPPSWMESIKLVIANHKYDDVGIFTVPLLGYDFEKLSSTGVLDSLGVYPTLYGRWFDKLAGESVDKLDVNVEPYAIPAACGAMMIVRNDVIKHLQEKDGYVFNESYFMYKEDIELSLRVREQGKKIVMIPSAPAYHCRGWDGRRDSPYWKRLLSAKNELTMHVNYRWRYVPFSVLKYFYVKYFEKK